MQLKRKDYVAPGVSLTQITVANVLLTSLTPGMVEALFPSSTAESFDDITNDYVW